MVLQLRISTPKYLTFVITLCLFMVFFLLLSNIQTGKYPKIIDDYSNNGRNSKTPIAPGEFFKSYKPSKQDSYCKLNFGLPTQLVYKKTDLEGTVEQGLNSSFRILYNVIEGILPKDAPGVTYVTHLTKEFVVFLAEIAKYWDGPLSVAAYIADGDSQHILENLLHLCYCIPEMSKLSFHIVIRKDIQLNFYLSRIMPPNSCDINKFMKSASERTTIINNTVLNRNVSGIINNKDKNNKEALNDWYPINVCRNAARQAAYTEYMMVCDVELMPSQGLAKRFIDMTESYKCLETDENNCGKKVYVVPVFEVESSEEVPRTKTELVHLMNDNNRAVYFHQIICGHCQRFPGLEQWKESDPGNLIKPLVETKREVPYHRWEPIYIGTKNEPLYLEKLSWEGFQDKMLQMHEMCLSGYKLVVLDGAFLVHWPGIKKAKRKDEPWRNPYIKMNQAHYDTLLKEISKKYPQNPQCSLNH